MEAFDPALIQRITDRITDRVIEGWQREQDHRDFLAGLAAAQREQNRSRRRSDLTARLEAGLREREALLAEQQAREERLAPQRARGEAAYRRAMEERAAGSGNAVMPWRLAAFVDLQRAERTGLPQIW